MVSKRSGRKKQYVRNRYTGRSAAASRATARVKRNAKDKADEREKREK